MSRENTLKKSGHCCDQMKNWSKRDGENIVSMMESNLEYLNEDGKKPVRRVVLKI